jgi:hypothetical protein
MTRLYLYLSGRVKPFQTRSRAAELNQGSTGSWESKTQPMIICSRMRLQMASPANLYWRCDHDDDERENLAAKSESRIFPPSTFPFSIQAPSVAKSKPPQNHPPYFHSQRCFKCLAESLSLGQRLASQLWRKASHPSSYFLFPPPHATFPGPSPEPRRSSADSCNSSYTWTDSPYSSSEPPHPRDRPRTSPLLALWKANFEFRISNF